MAKIFNKIRQYFGSDKDQGSGSDSNSENATTPSNFHVINVQQTPNPDAVQFIMNEPVITSGTKSFTSTDQAHGDPLGEALFNIFGIENVYLNENFVTINKSPIRGWNNMVDEIKHVLETHLKFYEMPDTPNPEKEDEPSGIKEFSPEAFGEMDDAQKYHVIDALFEHSIRPALASDGGGLTLQEVEGNLVKIEYQGACGSCPSSRTGTLHYIETMLRENLHPDLEIQAL